MLILRFADVNQAGVCGLCNVAGERRDFGHGYRPGCVLAGYILLQLETNCFDQL